MDENLSPLGSAQKDVLCASLDRVRISEDPRAKLKSWLGKILRVTITDGRVIVGYFACTDRDSNIILEDSWEFTKTDEIGEYHNSV